MSGVEEHDLVARVEGSAGIIRLNRPKAINAVTLEMFRGIDKALDRFETDPAVAVIVLEGAGERGLCAGGDIRALWESSKVDGDLGKILWREEYILNARIKKFPKPYVAFMDGIVMGGGVGLSAHASHRIVTERTRLAMPEVGLGFFPDVGGTYLLSRSPGEIGTYFWSHRPDHERPRRHPCEIRRCRGAGCQMAGAARGADQGSPGRDRG
ncbi:enoyl-CoA hydratase/carnithine racemase [Bradyrhizobium sp. LB13.1]